ncbi:DUF3560 domain-containing protein [Testudinibacter sp. P80/BLE/0925]|uniref:DUF3560 domain-containing protein n=1 Tax=Testudinibacter sp. TW-1 TaxID=3417757 RepID=UPI003D35FC10
MNLNTYAKFAPTVFVAKCPEAHTKGDIIVLTSKYGKKTEVEVFNLVKQHDDCYFYSFVRCDGLDSQARAQARAERYQSYAANANKRSEQHWQAAQEGSDFLSLGEPIKIGHHSEKKHRALIERNARRMDNAVAEMDKAKSYDHKITYWEAMAGKIDLSMPESLDYFAFELAKAKEKHQILKNEPEKREHSYSLTYAKNAVKELEKKVSLAQQLWA